MRRGLGFHARRSPGGFNPLSLFAGGINGAWYDPSDATTLFSDRAGTTPCATPGAGAVVPVGLMLDKSQGLVLGSETVTNGGPGFTTSTGWTAEGSNTVAVVNGELEVTLNLALFSGISGTNLTTVAGQWYRITVTARKGTTPSNFILRVDSSSNDITFTSTNSTTVNYYFRASGTSAAIRFLTAAASGSGTFYVTSVSVKALPGNHAIAANDTTARPELSARVNLLERTEEFNNAYWTKFNLNAFGSGSVANTTATLDPLGGNTADYIQENTANGQHAVFNASSLTLATSQHVALIGAKAAERNWLIINLNSGGANYRTWFNLSNGTVGTNDANNTPKIVSVGNGWYICSVTRAAVSGAVAYFQLQIADADGSFSYTGDGTSGIYIWGADLRPTNIGSQIPAYQRVADQYTYDSTGFPRRLVFNGTSSAMSTPANLNLSGTDKATVFAGVRRMAEAFYPIICEISATGWDNNNGTFGVSGGDPSGEWRAGVRGAAGASGTVYYDPVTYTPPISNVLSAQFDLAGSSKPTTIIPRVNGVVEQEGGAGTTAGGGNFGTYPLYIGARNNASLFLNGDIYSLIVVGSAVSAGNITATETWVNGKTGGVY